MCSSCQALTALTAANRRSVSRFGGVSVRGGRDLDYGVGVRPRFLCDLFRIFFSLAGLFWGSV